MAGPIAVRPGLQNILSACRFLRRVDRGVSSMVDDYNCNLGRPVVARCYADNQLA